jgi:hypothetical protein
MVAVFEGGWREVAAGGMPALAVVEGLDVREDGGPGVLTSGPGLPVEELGLKGGEEAFGDGVDAPMVCQAAAIDWAVPVVEPETRNL